MILVIDDDYSITASLGLLLKQAGYSSLMASTPKDALTHLENGEVRLVLQDMNFSRQTTGEEGLELLAQIRAARPDVPVILITAWGSISLAVAGMRAGASDFITKPWSNEQVLQSIGTALGLAGTSGAAPPNITRAELESQYDLSGVVGEDPTFLSALELLLRVASTDASVLITGDTGTGKEVVADAIHRNSARWKGPFAKVNLGGIPPGLFESEMFGHVRGAFTDANQDRSGWFADAQGGTLLLDEIGDLDLSCQVKLLRVLQERKFQRLGTNRSNPVDVRIVSATNVDLNQAIQEGAFREDLLYRINLISVRLPSLQERASDVPALARHFLGTAATHHKRESSRLTDAAAKWLQTRVWPGNVRQLQHLVERTLLLSRSTELGVEEFRRTLHQDSGEDPVDQLPSVGSMTMDEIERAMILKSLQHHQRNISRAAESLGMSRASLYRRLEKYGISS